MVDRRMNPTTEDSLELLSHNMVEILLPQVLAQGRELSEMRECQKTINKNSERMCRLAEETAEHSRETRAVVDAHLKESNDWKLVITKVEAHLEDINYWRKTRKMVINTVGAVVGAVGLVAGAAVSVHSLWNHIKGLWRP